MAKASLYSFSYDALEVRFSAVTQLFSLPGIRTRYPLRIHIVTQRFPSMVDTCSYIDLKKQMLILVLPLKFYCIFFSILST